LKNLSCLNVYFYELTQDRFLRKTILLSRNSARINCKLQQRQSIHDLVRQNILKHPCLESHIQRHIDQIRHNFTRSLVFNRLKDRPTRDALRNNNILPNACVSPSILTPQNRLSLAFRRDSLAQWLRHRLRYTCRVFSLEDRIRIEHILQRHILHRPNIIYLELQGLLSDPTYVAQVLCPSISSRIEYFEALAQKSSVR
jgi:hypothetical protein